MWKKQMKKMMNYLYDRVKTVNDSKIFAGLVILTMNLSSKLIPLPMSKTVESIVKYHFSQYILVFAISWMGTRDIFIALIVTSIFALLMEFLFNENSIFCCLSEGFVTNTIEDADDSDGVTREELDDALKTIEKMKNNLTEKEKSQQKDLNPTQTTQ
jgi:hypothetical protein